MSIELEQRIREAEKRLFASVGLTPDESFVDLTAARVRLRVLSVGAGPPLAVLPSATRRWRSPGRSSAFRCRS